MPPHVRPSVGLNRAVTPPPDRAGFDSWFHQPPVPDYEPERGRDVAPRSSDRSRPIPPPSYPNLGPPPSTKPRVRSASVDVPLFARIINSFSSSLRRSGTVAAAQWSSRPDPRAGMAGHTPAWPPPASRPHSPVRGRSSSRVDHGLRPPPSRKPVPVYSRTNTTPPGPDFDPRLSGSAERLRVPLPSQSIPPVAPRSAPPYHLRHPPAPNPTLPSRRVSHPGPAPSRHPAPIPSPHPSPSIPVGSSPTGPDRLRTRRPSLRRFNKPVRRTSPPRAPTWTRRSVADAVMEWETR